MNPKHQRRLCTVIGNGPGHIPRLEGVIVCFNDIEIDHSSLIRVRSGHSNGLYRHFMVSGGELLDRFSEQLQKSAIKLEKKLSTWPSSGLVALEALAELNIDRNIHCMPLAPSFARDHSCHSNIAKPSSYHNWLGERRYAFTKFSYIWESLLLAKPEGGYDLQFDPFDVFINGEVSLYELSALAKISANSLLKFITIEKLESIEHAFYLTRCQHRSSNWWFFDCEASKYIDLIFRKLAWCQQSVYDLN